MDPDRKQVNVRLDPEQERRVDEKRAALQKVLGRIPTRSEVVRMALDEFLKPATRKRGG
ncbi:MAG: hypothetical protein ACRD3F_14245 [Acidobacteriaceae bacterium]